MKNIIKNIGTAVLLIPAFVLGVSLFTPATTHAACDVQGGLGGAIDPKCAAGQGQQTGELFGDDSIITNVINIMLFIVGILCVIMIIYSGIRYVISRGDPSQVKNAKDTLLYSIVGLIVAIVAFALVNWVFRSLGES